MWKPWSGRRRFLITLRVVLLEVGAWCCVGVSKDCGPPWWVLGLLGGDSLRMVRPDLSSVCGWFLASRAWGVLSQPELTILA